MSDNVTISNIDSSTETNGYITAAVTVNVNGIDYTPNPFTVNATDAPSIIASVKQQAETYRTNVIAALAANSEGASATDLTTLDGTVIDL